VSAGERREAVPVSAVLALLPSPLLGPAAWRPVADELIRRGWTTVVPRAPRAAPRDAADVLQHFADAVPARGEVILVPHSNAGLYAAALAAARPVVGYVFVDAGLPEGTQVPLAPAGFRDFLRERAGGDGLLPPWTRWWDEAEVAGLFPDAESRARVEREEPRLPLSYFDGTVPVPPGWDDRPGAYLAFGDTYAAERRRAAERGWPVATMPGQHLHTLVAPAQVAAGIEGLLGAAGLR
jgi:hypothetical protein